MVVSRDTFLMGMLALRSLEFASGRAWSPILHEDGSFHESDVLEFRSLFPDASIIRRSEADGTLNEALKSFPACRAHRMNHNWFLKVFDTRHYAKHDRYIVLDSDIVFFRSPAFVLRWMEERADTCWFMEDTKEKYACPREQIEKALGFALWGRVNSGLDLMPRAAADLALAEAFLERCAPIAKEYKFLEQSLFAVFGSAWGRGGLLPPEYEISHANFRRRGAVCRHYIASSKNDGLFIEGASAFWFQSALWRLGK